jgi:hypothetical protein
MHQPLLRCFLPVWAASLALAQAPAPAVNPAAPAPGAPAPDHVVIAIGDERITAAQFEALIDSLPEQYRAMARGPAKRQFAEQLVAIKTWPRRRASESWIRVNPTAGSLRFRRKTCSPGLCSRT